MPEVDGQEKTEKATPKKLEESRERGEVARSMEINSLVIFTTGLMLLYFIQNFISNQFASLTRLIFKSLDVLYVNLGNISLLVNKGVYFYLLTMAPVALTIVVIAVGVSIAQVGFKISAKALEPKFNKLNVFKGIKKTFFSSRSFVEAAKSLLKLIIIGSFVYFILSDYVYDSSKLVSFSIFSIVSYMLDAAYSLVWKVALLFAVLAIFDFAYQKFKFNKDMMMTKQEVKEENKQTEGDPVVKSRIRKIQLETARRRMMQSIPDADVVITNPTHYAVALKYDMGNDSAPKVVAKGVDTLAQKIKSIAKENGVPIHEDKELARSLYKYCDVGDIIPQQLYQSVAEILAYIYRLKNNKKQKGIV